MIMRMFLLAAILVAFACLAAPGTSAQTTEIYRSGLWSAYSGTTEDQRRVCGIATTGADGRRVAIQQYSGMPGLQLELSKDSWTIPNNTPVTVQLKFDYRDQMQAQMIGAGRAMATQMPYEQSLAMIRALRDGRVLQVFFPDGNEVVWTGGLAGSGRAIAALNTCAASMEPAAPTQPFQSNPTPPPTPDSAAPSQPFRTPAAPSQLRL